jgi:FG-GAP-like repeat
LMADWDRDGIPDLVFIKTSNTPNGHVEVHVASGNSNYQTRVLETPTTFVNENDGTWLMADWDRDGIPDLVYIKTSNTPNGHVEVHVAGGSPPVTQYRLQIRRFNTSSLTNADADRILADAGTVLQTNDGPGDVACAVAFSREGEVTVFPEGDGSIDSAAEFSALIALPGWVKVVNQINWCGALIPGVIGCAPVPGSSLAVVRFTSSLEGILWAHEFGHNKGLNHRNDDANAVMNGTIGSTRRRVNASECAAYRTAPATVAVAAAGPPQPQLAGAPAQMDIRDFVRQVFIHGVPFEEASRYDPSAVPTLLAMLRDPAEEDFWATIAVVLGMIGDERVVEPMISFIQSGAGPAGPSPAEYRAKTSALMSLGYLVNRTGNQRALNYLQESVRPDAWAARNMAGTAPFQASTAERDIDLSKHAILGLALSGRPEAAQTLRSLQQPAGTDAARAFQAQIRDLVSEALNEHQRVSSQGLSDYYRTNRLR